MTRNLSLLTIPLAALLGLTLAATSADAGGRHGHGYKDNCETRIFQGEDEACYRINGDFVLFERRRADEPDEPEALRLPDLEDGGFTAAGADCGCQLRRKNDLICAGGGAAVIGNVDRRGKRIVGEILATRLSQNLARAVEARDVQEKFTARRVDLANCEAMPDR